MQLPFPDGAFDAVVCQFGAMFFPDKAKAFAETRRVLRPGGVFIFNVWDRIEDNEFADAVTTGIAPLFPADPPRFLARTPHGYHDKGVIARDLAAGGFAASPAIATVEARSRADSARVPAVAFCQGTPLRNEIEARDASRLGEATDAADRGGRPALRPRRDRSQDAGARRRHRRRLTGADPRPSASASPCARSAGASWRPSIPSSRRRSAGPPASSARRPASSAAPRCPPRDRRPRRCGRASFAA